MAKRKNAADPALHARIQDVHALGCMALEARRAAPGKYATGVVAKLKQELKMSEASLRKAMKFAQTYMPQDLKAFCRLRGPDGSPLSITIAYSVMYLPDRRKRQQLERLAASEGWSVSRLQAEVKQRYGVNEKASKGGRPSRLPASRNEMLQQLSDRCDQWQRWLRLLESSRDEGAAFDTRMLPATLRRKVLAVTRAMQDLSRAVGSARAQKRKQ